MNTSAGPQQGGVVGLAVALVAVAASIALAGDAEAGRTAVERELQLAKAASARFHSVVQAERAGYTQASPCIPGEGIHYDKRSLIDTTVTAGEPEVLLYEVKPNGRLGLVGVEYVAVALANTAAGPAPWFLETPPPDGFANPAPVLFGETFDGPMAGHNPAMPWHYDIHVWLWEPNPNGMFVLPNPNVTC